MQPKSCGLHLILVRLRSVADLLAGTSFTGVSYWSYQLTTYRHRSP